MIKGFVAARFSAASSVNLIFGVSKASEHESRMMESEPSE